MATSNQATSNSKDPGRGGDDDVDAQMQQVLQLLSARSRGQASNDDVEQAVSKILSTAGVQVPPSASAAAASSSSNSIGNKEDKKPKASAAPPPPTTVSRSHHHPPNSSYKKITLDTDDYDFDDNNNNNNNNQEQNTTAKKAPHVSATKSSPSMPAPSKDEQDDSAQKLTTPTTRKKFERRPLRVIEQEKERKIQYDHIPLGRQGAKMMTSFGDGKNPKPEAVEAALLGARRLLQVTIQDARAHRRRAREQFKRAQFDVAKNKPANPSVATTGDNLQQQPSHVADPQLLYRALEGYDKLAYEPKCGFDYEQLKSLFPEEMHAYARWNQLRSQYATQTKDEKSVARNEDAEEDDEEEAVDDNDNDESHHSNEEDPTASSGNAKEGGGGHLQARAMQFDVRTDLMDQGWYMKFSEVRKGSFLPRQIKQEGDNEWDEKRKKVSSRGKAENGIWANMPARSARFLHWIGFDPNKGLPPPNEETTNALGFLGYDFVGRIVEKAIFLKNLEKAKKVVDKDVDERNILVELGKGEQLDEQDIEKAMNDADIKPIALHGVAENDSNPQKPAAQLYFGPGFEDRLEMELDEMLCGASKRNDLTKEEIKIRKEECELFARISEPPSTNNPVMQLLGKDDNDEFDGEDGSKKETHEQEAGTKKRRGRPPKQKQEGVDNPSNVNTADMPKKKRGRPRKTETKSTDEATEVKRKRGRPRKNPPKESGGDNHTVKCLEKEKESVTEVDTHPPPELKEAVTSDTAIDRAVPSKVHTETRVDTAKTQEAQTAETNVKESPTVTKSDTFEVNDAQTETNVGTVPGQEAQTGTKVGTAQAQEVQSKPIVGLVKAPDANTPKRKLRLPRKNPRGQVTDKEKSDGDEDKTKNLRTRQKRKTDAPNRNHDPRALRANRSPGHSQTEPTENIDVQQPQPQKRKIGSPKSEVTNSPNKLGRSRNGKSKGSSTAAGDAGSTGASLCTRSEERSNEKDKDSDSAAPTLEAVYEAIASSPEALGRGRRSKNKTK